MNGPNSEEVFVRQYNGSSFGGRTQLTNFYTQHAGVNGLRWLVSRTDGPRLCVRVRKNPDGTDARNSGVEDSIFGMDPNGPVVTDWPDGT